MEACHVHEGSRSGRGTMERKKILRKGGGAEKKATPDRGNNKEEVRAA